MEKTLTIITPVFNLCRVTANCIMHIFKSDFPKEKYLIYFVDNASTDKTYTFLSYLQEVGEPIKVIRNETNMGYLLGTNLAWKQTNTPYILLMNNDVILEKNTISLMLSTFEKDPKIGIVGAIQKDPARHYGKTYFYRGRDFDKHPDARYVVSMTDEEKKQDYVEVEIVGVSCAMVKREVWEKVGFYDERFVPCMSEQEDFCLKTLQAGYKIVTNPKAEFIHGVGQTTTLVGHDYFQGIIERNLKVFRDKWREELSKE